MRKKVLVWTTFWSSTLGRVIVFFSLFIFIWLNIDGSFWWFYYIFLRRVCGKVFFFTSLYNLLLDISFILSDFLFELQKSIIWYSVIFFSLIKIIINLCLSLKFAISLYWFLKTILERQNLRVLFMNKEFCFLSDMFTITLFGFFLFILFLTFY